MAGPSDATPVAQAQLRAPPEIKNLVDFLRGKNGPKVRTGILNGKRVEYFKGKTAIRVLQGPAYQKAKKVPAVKDEAEALATLEKALPNAFFLRVDRPTPNPAPPSGTPKTLQLAPSQSFISDAYYAWFYDGSPLYNYLGAGAMVLVIFAGVLFPLWPATLRLGVWYLSILALGFIGALIVLAIVRLVFYCATVVLAKTPIWIFPNLFEDVGFIDSFIPAWEYELPKKKKSKSKSKTKSSSSSSASGKSKKSKSPRSAAAAAAGAEGGSGSVVGDLTGSKPVQPQMEEGAEGAEAAGAASGAGAGAATATATATAVQGQGQGVQGAGARLRQVTMEEADDE